MSALDHLQKRFAELFGAVGDDDTAGVFVAPGRVNLIGEHTDYNDGFVLPFAINRATTVIVRLNDSGVLRLASTAEVVNPDEADDAVVEVALEGLKPGSVDGWAAYPAGVIWALGELGASIEGADILVDSTVPSGAGLSSSAALECSIALAIRDLTGAELDLDQLALACQRAENEMVGAPTGIMDQVASLRGAEGSAVFLDCQDRSSELVPLALAGDRMRLLIIDTGVEHAHATGGYADRRRSCETAARKLGVESLREVSVDDLAEAESKLDAETFRRLRHVVTENARVQQTAKQLRKKGSRHIGPLLDASHASMRDDFEISCPELDTAVAAAQLAGAYGARMTGGGFGGSAIALVRENDVDAVSRAVRTAFERKKFTEPAIFEVIPSAGAHRVEEPESE